MSYNMVWKEVFYILINTVKDQLQFNFRTLNSQIYVQQLPLVPIVDK